MAERTISNLLDQERAYVIYHQNGYRCGSILQAIQYFNQGEFWRSLSTKQRVEAFKVMMGYSSLEKRVDMQGSADVFLARFEINGRLECFASIFSLNLEYIGLLQDHQEYLKQFCFSNQDNQASYVIMPLNDYARAMHKEGFISKEVCEIIEEFIKVYKIQSFGSRFFELEESITHLINQTLIHSYPIPHPIKLVAFFRNDIFEIVSEFSYAFGRALESLSDQEEFDIYQRLSFKKEKTC